MVRTGGRGGRGGGTKDESVKDLFHRIGGIIQQQVHNAAETYTNELHGDLSKARFEKEPKSQQTEKDPCKLDQRYHTNVTNGNSHPCGNGTKERFSDVRAGECDKNKISGSNDNEGACAPFRRLHLCVTNLENINKYENINNDTLLAEVCLAAKHEGKSLVQKYKEYKEKKNTNFDTNLCTILARSFADIADIIRGKDLYLGDQERKQHLEKRLETMFEKIQKNNNNKLSNLSTKEVREYWWALNRDQVWKAITCDAGAADEYFKKSGKLEFEFTGGQCGRDGENVPTYLDYVPQFFRWFDEWSENFCRIRYDNLEKVKEACRGEGNTKYCSQNGYDCTKPIWEKGTPCTSNDCNKCSSKCYHYEIWLDDRGKEFKKQKEKYNNEINGNNSPHNNTNNSINNKYYKVFYDTLKDKDYGTVNHFLNLLNEGMYCKKKLKDEENFDFNKIGVEHTFYRSNYCQPCPNCVVQCKDGNCTEKTGDDKCRSKIIEKILRDEEPTEINVLHSGDGQGLITEKLKQFCSNQTNYTGENDKTWKCYNKNSDYNNCEMNISSYKDSTDPNLMLSIQCFYSWAQNLLIDTIKWEHELKDCINNTNVTDCENECNKNCKCYEKWINTKKNEWTKLKKVLENKKENPENYYKILNNLFDTLYFEVMYEFSEEKEKEKSKELTEDLQKKIASLKGRSGTGKSQDAIEFLLDHLNDNAITCKDNNSLEADKNCPENKTNPCIKKNPKNTKPTKTVKHIAEMMQRRARKQLEKGAGETKLKGDATKGKYTSSGKAVALNDICDITLEHSNRNNENSKGPCYNKDGHGTMFDINEGWKPGSAIQMSDKDAFMPPRRQHFCTSNLEYLQTSMSPLNGSDKDPKLVNNSFLGDVLLSANKQVEWIKKNYKDQRHLNDNETMCRAVKYSFADLGDIIKGTDLWDKNHGENKIQETLKQIFGTLYNLLSKDVPQKYGDDKDNKIPYKKLREDWWEANRHQVWRAMKCEIKKDSKIPCSGIPIEDYIPQRLRWMTELAEWYVKFKSQESEKCKRRVIMINSG
ncbi:hypothetical protein PFMC_06007, partial [Plasmodium falciparum CAMP/Malaysia]